MKTNPVSTKSTSEVAGFAGSLVALAKVGPGLDVVDRDLRLVKETVSGHMDLKRALADPSLPVEKKQTVVRELFDKKISGTTLGFLDLLVGMDRTELIPALADEFASRLEAEENKVIAEVTTAAPMDSEFSKRLARRLSEMAGREVSIRPKVDAGLIGGVVVRIGGKLLDGSVSSRLAKMRDQMMIDMRGK